jgi:dTDP-glucose 4,6-dehydratase
MSLSPIVQWYLNNQAWYKNVQAGSYQRQRLGEENEKSHHFNRAKHSH